MLFNSFQYWIFFFIVATLFYSTPFRRGKILLLLASVSCIRSKTWNNTRA